MQILCPKFPLHFIYCFLQVLESPPIPLYPVGIFISPVRLQIFKGGDVSLQSPHVSGYVHGVHQTDEHCSMRKSWRWQKIKSQ